MIERLEEDLLAAQQGGRNPGSGAAEASSGLGFGGGGGGGFLEAAAADANGDDGSGGGGGDGGHRTMIGVICAQRDRLKTRVGQLEEENARVREHISKTITYCEDSPVLNLLLWQSSSAIQAHIALQHFLDLDHNALVRVQQGYG